MESLDSPPHPSQEALAEANLRLTEALKANDLMTAALKRSEARLRLITDTIPAHIAYFDNTWHYRYSNLRYAEWFGKRRDQVENHLISEVIGAHVFRAVESSVQRALDGEQVSYEYAMERSNGEIVHARSTLVPEIGPDGSVLGCFVQAFDISEQRRTQAMLMQAQKMEAIGQLTGGLAHDFNNLLTVVMGNLRALHQRLEGDPAVEDFVEPALHAAQRGVELVKRLLTFSRQQPLAPETLDVNAIITNLARLMRRSLPEGITLTATSPSATLHALADPHQFENAVINLIINARDAMPNGGKIRVEVSAEILDPSAAGDLEVKPGRYVQIAVSDNGMGMDGSTLARMFEPFFTTKPFGHGSGLGLSMVYGFLKQSGGSVRVRSRQAQGTTIALLLPAMERGDPVEALHPTAASEKSPAQQLVLLVDDDHEVRKVTRMLLNELGYPVLEADNGDEGLEMLRHIPDIDILITDLVMPNGLDGATLAQLAREQRPELHIVLISGYARNLSLAQQARLGQPGLANELPFPFLNKPFTREELAATLAAGFTPHRT